MKKKLVALIIALAALFSVGTVGCFGGGVSQGSSSSSVVNSSSAANSSEGTSSISENSSIADASSDEDSSSDSAVAEKSYEIRFVQAGKADVVITVKEGESLTDIPAPVVEAGYDIVWDKTEFVAVSEDITVTAIKTAKTYVITYDLGEVKNNPNAQIASATQEVKYNESFTLATPTCPQYLFSHWVITGTETRFDSGTYTKLDNLSLTAVWTVNEDDMWTGQH